MRSTIADVARLSRRAAIAGGVAAAAGAVWAGTQGVAEAVVLPSLRRTGDVDDSAAFRRATATGRPIHAPAGRGSGANGVYVIGSTTADTLPSRLTLYGDGIGKTVIRVADKHHLLLHCDSRSPDPARNIAGLRFRDLSFASTVASEGFAEFQYLMMLNGVTDVLIERVGFIGFRGDGLHLGSSFTAKTERHNRNVVVRDCLFDGVNSNNRNAISVIDVTGLVIERCRFLNCTRTGDGTVNAGDPFNPMTGLGMPGPIDIEPNDDAFAVTSDITIRDNHFSGGGGYAVALHPRPNDLVTRPSRNIRVIGNTIEDRVGGIDMTGFVNDAAMKPGASPYDVLIDDNEVRRCQTPFRISGVKGMTMTRNRYLDCTGRAEFNNTAPVADVTASGNRFERVGSAAAPFGLWIRTCERLTLRDNQFVDCGAPQGSGGTAIAIVGGTPRAMTIAGNGFTSPLGRMDKALLVFRDAKVDAGQIKVADNRSTLTGPSIAQVLGR